MGIRLHDLYFVASVKTDRLPFANMEKKYCKRSNHENAMGKIHLSHQPCNQHRLFIPNQWNPQTPPSQGKNSPRSRRSHSMKVQACHCQPPWFICIATPMGTKPTPTTQTSRSWAGRKCRVLQHLTVGWNDLSLKVWFHWFSHKCCCSQKSAEWV